MAHAAWSYKTMVLNETVYANETLWNEFGYWITTWHCWRPFSTGTMGIFERLFFCETCRTALRILLIQFSLLISLQFSFKSKLLTRKFWVGPVRTTRQIPSEEFQSLLPSADHIRTLRFTNFTIALDRALKIAVLIETLSNPNFNICQSSGRV